MNRLLPGVTVLVAAAAIFCSCDNFGEFERARQDFHYTYTLHPGGTLDLDNANGSIEIAGWDRDSIDVSGTKFASSEDRLNEIQIKVNVTGQSASIVTEAPRNVMFGGFGARYRIRIPRRTVLGRVHTTNGSFSVEDLEGGGNVRSTNGRVSMARLVGDYQAETTNGGIEFDEMSGAERAGTTNGSVRGRLNAGQVDARSTNGTIDLTILKPAGDKPIRLSTTNGSIMLSLAEFHDNPVSLQTTHGGVTIRLPADVNAQVRAETSLSTITTDLHFSSTEEASKHYLGGIIGRGGPLISANTTTGKIRIERY